VSARLLEGLYGHHGDPFEVAAMLRQWSEGDLARPATAVVNDVLTPIRAE